MANRAMTNVEIPEGYVLGVGRNPEEMNQVTHLYKGTFDNPGLPMCVRGWNRNGGESYSIWHNVISFKGVCKVCLRRAQKGLDGVLSPAILKKCKHKASKGELWND